MKTWLLKGEWTFEIYAHKHGKRFKVVASNADRRDRQFARRLARLIERRLKRAPGQARAGSSVSQ